MSLRVLIVEPSPTQAENLRSVFTAAGHRVTVARSVNDATEQTIAAPVDVVLVNYTLPDGTGPDLCRQFAAHAARPCLIVIAESGNAEQILTSLAAGADGFCIKSHDTAELPAQVNEIHQQSQADRPVIAETVRFQNRDYHLSLTAAQWLNVLLVTLTNLDDWKQQCRRLSGASTEASPRAASDDSAPTAVVESSDEPQPAEKSVPAKRLTVILAEDSLTNQVLGRTLLTKAGYDVLLATNGQEVLAHLDDPGVNEIAFILMDVEMPEMDGLEATRIIRTREVDADRRLPILAMTAHADDEGRRACLAAGMDACLAKPLRMDEVTDALSKILQASLNE